MEESQKKIEKKDVNFNWDIKKYLVIAVITLATFCCGILFFFFLYRYHGIAAYWQKIMSIFQPIIIGFVVAYLLNPVMMFLEKHFFALLQTKMKSERKAKKMARSLGTAGSLLFLLLIIFLLLDMMIPELIKSIQNMTTSLPSEVNSFVSWIQKVLSEDSELANMLGASLVNITNYIESLFQGQILPQINTYLASITTGVISAVRVLFNFIIGLIIAIYVLMSKETFIGQSKKVIYAVLSPKYGNSVIHMVRISNQMFGSFISGKILDSAIIGVICYVGLTIMHMPYSLLVAVIVGVTNVVPFFGPYVGAVPSVVLIALAEPIKGLYFLIFILVLQQIDGNIIGPKILGDSTGLSSFWVVFAILAGGGLFGFMGMLLGVPTFAVIYYLLREAIAYILKKRKLPEDTIAYIQAKDVDVATGQIRYEEKK